MTERRVHATTLPEEKCLISTGTATMPIRLTELQSSFFQGITGLRVGYLRPVVIVIAVELVRVVIHGALEASIPFVGRIEGRENVLASNYRWRFEDTGHNDQVPQAS